MLLSACGSAPERASDSGYRTTSGSAPPPVIAVSVARDMVGVPYRYGGESPREGFDCSGLVHYSYLRAGLRVPRTTRDQFRRGRPVPRGRLAPGDLLFFRLDGRKVSHVGIYMGNGRFVHAPSSGKTVSIASLGN
ncbi:MAG: C40 family peptidase, partial [Gammaproteobacteria bacterium]|nr:C40 family peptidase [Gammaproteobacteria bacterium]NIT62304.1 C40 family peptidase [Gammaproteobacteria bacterium]NIY30884.1 NlpC/P60 family protein [Gammaproteobacteria bacterium]